jgi:hypothetical protein
VVAGDGDRASVAFLGTPTPGSTQDASFGKNRAGDTFVGGTWHMYVATTYDRGLTWTTVDATPKDPVQRGCIWNAGGSNPCRNLLDFNAITVDKTGRVLIGFADGCVGPDVAAKNDCVDSADVKANGLVNHGAIIRQMSGRTLFKAYDTRPTTVPQAGTKADQTGLPALPAAAEPGVKAPAAPTATAGATDVRADKAASSRGLAGPAGAALAGLLLMTAGVYAATRRAHRAR